MHVLRGQIIRVVVYPAIMIFMTFFLVKYLAKGAGTEAKLNHVGSYQQALASVGSSKEKG